MAFSLNSCWVKSIFSPVLVDLFSIKIASLGTPLANAMEANLSASASDQISWVSRPSPPEKTSRGA